MGAALVEGFCYFSGAAFLTSILNAALSIESYAWHCISSGLALIPLCVWFISQRQPVQEEEIGLGITIAQAQPEQDSSRRDFIASAFNWAFLRGIPSAIAIQFVIRGWL